MKKEIIDTLKQNIRVDKKTKCWVWTGKLHPKGYAYTYLKGISQKTITVHKFIWEAINGKVPKGFQLHHRCRYRSCVNPRHLILTTHAKHMKHHAKSGVWAGENNSQSKLTGNKILALRALHSLGIIPKGKLAVAAKIPYRTFYYAVRGEGWKHLPNPESPVEWEKLIQNQF